MAIQPVAKRLEMNLRLEHENVGSETKLRLAITLISYIAYRTKNIF